MNTITHVTAQLNAPHLENAELYDLEKSSDSILSPLTSTSSIDEIYQNNLYTDNTYPNNLQHIDEVYQNNRYTNETQIVSKPTTTKNKKQTSPKSLSPELKGKIDSTHKQEIETYAYKVKKTIKSLTSNKWLSIALAVIIVLIVCILFLFLPKTQVFYKPNTSIELILKEHSIQVRKEILEKIKTQETQVIPLFTKALLYTNEYPETYKMLEQIPFDISYAGIISLKPDFFQTKHHGYGPNANKTYRYFYVISESSVGCSGIWIDGEKKMFSADGIICADVSRESCLFNDCVRRNAIVVFFDVINDRKAGVSMANDINNDDLLKHFTLPD